MNKYTELSELFDEISSYLNSLIEETENLRQELTYLEDFIALKSLCEEYAYFRENAILDPSEELFPRYILRN